MPDTEAPQGKHDLVLQKLLDKVLNDFGASQNATLEIERQILDRMTKLADAYGMPPSRGDIRKALETAFLEQQELVRAGMLSHDEKCCNRGDVRMKEHNDVILAVTKERFDLTIAAIERIYAQVAKMDTTMGTTKDTVEASATATRDAVVRSASELETITFRAKILIWLFGITWAGGVVALVWINHLIDKIPVPGVK